jgi:hypothetical protein
LNGGISVTLGWDQSISPGSRISGGGCSPAQKRIDAPK